MQEKIRGDSLPEEKKCCFPYCLGFSRRIFLVLGIVFLLVLTTLGGYYCGYNLKMAKLAEAPVDVLNKVRPDKQSDLQERSWQTYSDPEILQVSLGFPADWVVTKEAHLGKFAPMFTTSPDSYQQGKRFGSLSLSRRELSSWGSNKKLEDTFDLDEVSDSVLSEDQLTVGGEKALRKVIWEGNYYKDSTGKTGLIRKHVHVLHNGFDYRILYYEEEKNKQIRSPAEWQYDLIFDQILSTFKFLE